MALDENPSKAFLDGFPMLTAEEWQDVYEQAGKQTLLGVAYSGVGKLPLNFYFNGAVKRKPFKA
ncbi:MULTISPECIES: hypothetical protein [unclassified Fibrobacter]|uniref:hypothetical protein n=1 Tax=unclassified Fibrobacter TaxID=2634177 RepID=UPI0011B1FC43|nr:MULTISPECIES: hypothetical protein [unclassified Fibrobacter]